MQAPEPRLAAAHLGLWAREEDARSGAVRRLTACVVLTQAALRLFAAAAPPPQQQGLAPLSYALECAWVGGEALAGNMRRDRAVPVCALCVLCGLLTAR